jgi:hypothetical protein
MQRTRSFCLPRDRNAFCGAPKEVQRLRRWLDYPPCTTSLHRSAQLGEGRMTTTEGCTIRSFLRARGDPGYRGRKSYSAKHLVGARGLARLRPLVPGAGQLLDLSFWARPRAMDGGDARVLWKASYRRNSHALGDVRSAAHFSLFVYAFPAPPAFVRASSQVLDDRSRDLVHPPGGSHLPGGYGHLRQLVPVNRAVAGKEREDCG